MLAASASTTSTTRSRAAGAASVSTTARGREAGAASPCTTRRTRSGCWRSSAAPAYAAEWSTGKTAWPQRPPS
ncbi:UNVERIFIED_CONTAM: hypothetical protein FKN15_018131 [Acipenser sinensis]